MSRLRGPVPVLAFTPEAQTRSQLSLSWGVETFKTAAVEHTDEMVAQVDEQLLNIGRVEKGDLVVIIAGSPPGIPGSTNAMRVHRMGDAVDGVAPAYRRIARPRLAPRRGEVSNGRPVAALAVPDASRARRQGAPGGIRTHTECCLSSSTLPLVYRGPSGVRGYRSQVVHLGLGKSRVTHYSLARDLGERRVARPLGRWRATSGRWRTPGRPRPSVRGCASSGPRSSSS